MVALGAFWWCRYSGACVRVSGHREGARCLAGMGAQVARVDFELWLAWRGLLSCYGSQGSHMTALLPKQCSNSHTRGQHVGTWWPQG
jgi:hypothetical protein